MIAISLSPNTEPDDVWLSIRLLFSPWRWNSETPARNLKKAFLRYFGNNYKVYLVNSGRSAEYVILKSLDIGDGDEVLVQAFNCVAVPNSVLWTGATPIYVDIDDNYNMDPEDMEKKITKNTKAIIVQHTFGTQAQIKKIKSIATEHNLILIEDCAHALGLEIDGRKAGTFGDYSFFSFGRDKVISGVFGGMILSKKEINYENLGLKTPRLLWQVQQLLHPILFNLIVLPTYRFGYKKITIGKLALFLFQQIGLLSKPVSKKEMRAEHDSNFPRKIAPVLAELALNQFRKLGRLNRRRKLAYGSYTNKLDATFNKIESTNSLWLRYPVRTNKARLIYEGLKDEGILLGRWYQTTLEPASSLVMFEYKKGSCPKAEESSKEILNLPTNIRLKDQELEKLINKVNSYV